MMEFGDMLCGGGGTTAGAKAAGAKVRYAINHWRLAIDVHQRNHPEIEHFLEDACLADYTRWCGLDGILASIACQGHSNAATNCGKGKKRGSLPKHDNDRATAHAITHALELTGVPFALIECVVELRRWKLYPEWCGMIGKLGYALHEHVVDAADYGAPATRRRLFITAVRGRTPLVLRIPKRQHVGIGAAFDASITDGWRPISMLSAKRRARIAVAQERRGRGLIAVRYTSTDIGRAPHETAPTMTTKHQCAWVIGDSYRPWLGHEYAVGLGFKRGYLLTGKVTTDAKLMGNAVSPLPMEVMIEEVMARG